MAGELRKVEWQGYEWFFDERLKELRDTTFPGCITRLDEFEVEVIKYELEQDKSEVVNIDGII